MGGGPVVATGGTDFSHLVDLSKPWYTNSRLVLLNACIALLLVTSATNGYDGAPLSDGLQSLQQWQEDFDHPAGQEVLLLTGRQGIGGLIALPLSPYLNDGFGRRAGIVLGATIMIVGTVLQSASNTIQMFIGARFLLGFGCCFAASAAPLLITEVAFPTQRAQATSLYNSLWFLGSIIAAWTTFGTFHIPNSWSWRIPSALQGLPSVLQVFMIWFVPESPRWLMSKGRNDQALHVLSYYHANGDKNAPLVEHEFQEIKTALERDAEIAQQNGWLSLVKTPGNRRRLRIIIALACFSQWSGNGLISYYLGKVFDAIGITDPTMQLLINGILNIYNFIIAISAGLLCDKAGRRPLFLASTIGMTVFWTGQTICFGIHSETGSIAAGHAVVAMIFLYSAFYDIAFTPLIVSYTVEILPFHLRAKGFTIFALAGSLSTIFNQYVNPVALESFGWKYYIFYVVWLTFESFFIYFYLLETKDVRSGLHVLSSSG
ncbi:general substrate transporter [Schizophyllum commune]|nr:general substrate transporter [Schizophyllum commune Loenen D]